MRELARLERLKRFFPAPLARLISDGAEDLLKPHRRKVAVVMVDLRGFTAFAEAEEPEDVMEVLGEYHAALGEIIYAYEGTLERFVGDGVMVLFNDPIPCPDPAQRAVKMAIDMIGAVETLATKWQRLGHHLGFGIGIAQGHATLGRIGFEGRYDYAVIGTVANLASRLCDEAEPGRILISQRVMVAVEDLIAAETIGKLTLKGIQQPVDVYGVIELKT